MPKQIVLLLFVLWPLGLAAQEVGDHTSPPAQGAAQRLSVLPGFKVSVFASRLDNPRGMAFSPDGILYACDMKDGCVLALDDPNGKGYCSRPQTVIQGLDHPHSLVFWGGDMYVGETTRISRFTLSGSLLDASDGRTVMELPRGGATLPAPWISVPTGNCMYPLGALATPARKKTSGTEPSAG